MFHLFPGGRKFSWMSLADHFDLLRVPPFRKSVCGHCFQSLVFILLFQLPYMFEGNMPIQEATATNSTDARGPLITSSQKGGIDSLEKAISWRGRIPITARPFHI